MVKRINEVFEDADHAKLVKDKQKLSSKLGRPIGWREYILIKGGIK